MPVSTKTKKNSLFSFQLATYALLLHRVCFSLKLPLCSVWLMASQPAAEDDSTWRADKSRKGEHIFERGSAVYLSFFYSKRKRELLSRCCWKRANGRAKAPLGVNVGWWVLGVGWLDIQKLFAPSSLNLTLECLCVVFCIFY